MEAVIRSNLEVEALKQSWLADPYWDLENSEGFEAHREELLAFSEAQEAIWENERTNRQSK